MKSLGMEVPRFSDGDVGNDSGVVQGSIDYWVDARRLPARNIRCLWKFNLSEAEARNCSRGVEGSVKVAKTSLKVKKARP